MDIRITIDAEEPSPDELASLYETAFPDEDLLPLVTALLALGPGVLSLAAREDGRLAGHILFTYCTLENCRDGPALLGPLAVTPAMQGRGIGTSLIRKGVNLLMHRGLRRLLVLGDPAYYGPFGFQAEKKILPPHRLPPHWQAAWQSLCIGAGEDGPPGGQLQMPAPWQPRAVWSDQATDTG